MLSMLWLWMQREGTLALNGPMDIRTAIGYSAETQRVRVEQIYRVDGYSVYYRQGNEFADSRSVATIGFAEEPVVRRVKVVLHEDLHGDAQFRAALGDRGSDRHPARIAGRGRIFSLEG